MLRLGGLRGTVAFLMAGNLLSAALALVLAVLIGRGFGQSALGIYASAVGWVLPLSLVVDAGMGTLISRDLAADVKLDSRRIIHAVMIERLVMGLPIMVALIALAPILAREQEAVDGLRISAPLVLILPMYGAVSAVFRARGGLKLASGLNLGMLISQIAMTMAAAALGMGVLAILAANTLSTAIQLTAAVYLWRRLYAEQGEFTSEEVDWRALRKRGGPFGMAAFTASTQMRMAPIVLERFASSTEAGLYAAAYRLIEAARLIPQALLETLMPRLSNRFVSLEGRSRLLVQSTTALVGFGLAAGIGALILSPPVINLVYGADFAGSAPVLMILAWSLLPMSLKFLRGVDWIGQRRERELGWLSVAVVGVQLVLMISVAGPGGAVAAAAATVLAEVMGMLLLWALDERRMRRR